MAAARVELLWLPLGAGGWFVRRNGRAYEALVAWRAHRPRRDLYHSALLVTVSEGTYAIEMTPARRGDHGAVAHGPVGCRCAGRLRIFRYEIRRWLGGTIPDADEAVGRPWRCSDDEAVTRRLLDLVPAVPTATWGRDELRAGEMWNSNSVIAWLLARAGADMAAIRPPAGGRAPGWDAGVAAATSCAGRG